jgi:hypothetical protein
MTEGEYSDVKQLYKLSVAYDAFWSVADSCKFLIDQGWLSMDPGYYAMAVGILTLYARPFEKSKRIGRLDSEIIPQKFEGLHSELITLRDKGFAHSDFEGQLVDIGRMTEVRIYWDGPVVGSFSTRPVFEPLLLPSIKELCDHLADKVKAERDTFFKRVMQIAGKSFELDDVGKEFVLNIEDETGSMIKRAPDSLRDKYLMIRVPS